MKEKVSKYLFVIGFLILSFVFYNIFITSIFLIFKFGITNYNFIFASILTLITLIIFFVRDKEKEINEKIRKYFIIFCITLLTIAASISFSTKSYDTSWDSNVYHKGAIGMLKEGWNPVHETAYEYLERNDTDFKEYIDYFCKTNDPDKEKLFAQNYYGKAEWYYGANIYQFTKNIESAKSINLFISISSLLIICSILLRKFNWFISIAISILTIFHPIFAYQYLSLYVDANLCTLLFLLIFLLIDLINKSKDKKTSIYFLICFALAILTNVKITGLVYAGFYGMALYAFIFFKSLKDKYYKQILKELTITTIIALLLSIFLVGWATYPKNYITRGHPFYPLSGEGKIDIITTQQPVYFKEKTAPERLFISVFSKTENILGGNPKKAEYKIPFTVYKEENAALVTYDIRIGGFGVLFGGILILSLVILPFSLKTIYKKNKDLFICLSILLGVTIISAFLIDYSWWARLFPQLYLIPLITAISLAYLNDKKLYIKRIFYVFVVLLFINSLICSYSYTKNFMLESKIVKNQYLGLLSDYNNYNEIIVSTEYFYGTYYNFKDYYSKEGKDLNKVKFLNPGDFKKIKDTENYYRIYYGNLEIYGFKEKLDE